MIASQYHGGQTSALYQFASTGRCDLRTFNEVQREINSSTPTVAEKIRLVCLLHYLATRMDEETHDVRFDDWHKLWLRQPGEPL